ncbi:MAG: hypothetical protein AAF699_07500 [Pseudomonadota bacterium]
MKIWLLTLLLTAPALAESDEKKAESPVDSDSTLESVDSSNTSENSRNWLDSTHDYANQRAYQLAQWMDDYFGAPNYDLESAESLVRVDFKTEWDEENGTKEKIKLRGKLNLPKVSKRLDLVFSDDSGDELDSDQDLQEDNNDVGLVYEVTEGKHDRFDLTMGLRWNRLRPGVRYRYQGGLWDNSNYRFTQRFQWDNDNGAFSTSQIEFNHGLSENRILRWNNRAIYGEETDGVEWLSRVAMLQRARSKIAGHRVAMAYYASVKGLTDPESYIKNYRVGVLYRRSIYRRYLFLEVEPAYNYRKKEPDENRQFAWSIGVTLEVALESGRNKRDRAAAEDKTDKDRAAAQARRRLPHETGAPYREVATAGPPW